MPRPTPRKVVSSANTVGQHISSWRKILGLTAQQLSEQAGISRSTLQKLEHGDGGVSLKAYLGVCNALGIMDMVTKSSDPLQTDLGIARATQALKKRVR